MIKTITVKGTGKVSVKPDYVVITLSLESMDMDYQKSVELSAEKIEEISSALQEIGFNKGDLKTESFDVRAKHEDKRNKRGEYVSVFIGYKCTHRLNLSFDLDNKKLSKTLDALSELSAKPTINISFTVKDKNEVNEQLLKSATENAKRIALILCESSETNLGQLITINYNWDEINLVSSTKFSSDEDVYTDILSIFANTEPKNINVTDTVSFVWEIQ